MLFFNVQKCKVIHIGKGNPTFTYQMEDKNENICEITTVTSEKDLRLTFQHDLFLFVMRETLRLWEHSALLSTFIKLPFVFYIFILSIFEWPFYTGFTVLE